MNLVNGYMKLVRQVLPSPLSIAVILTFLTAVLAAFLTNTPSDISVIEHVALSWNKGIWELLSFTMQMMLMLVLGHTIALSAPIHKSIRKIASMAHNNAQAAVLVTLFSLLAGYFNWGLGLIFGAILARKVGEYAKETGIALNYPLIAACGYTSLMVWHGGLSGSAPLTVSMPDHSLVDQMGVIPTTETIFSSANLVAVVSSLILIGIFAYFLGKRSFHKSYPPATKKKKKHDSSIPEGAERFDHALLPGILFGLIFIAIWISQLLDAVNWYRFITLNSINFLLFGLALVMNGSLFNFSKSAQEAIKGSTGILIQFPLYAGIMGIMKYTGLLEVFANFFIDISNEHTFPLFAYISSAVVNVLVPSGGGQWQVQGPILIEAAKHMHVPLSKTVMALAYGDQITNMLQPFWALPLLGITGLKARDILPYSILFMMVGGLLFLSILYLF